MLSHLKTYFQFYEIAVWLRKKHNQIFVITCKYETMNENTGKLFIKHFVQVEHLSSDWYPVGKERQGRFPEHRKSFYYDMIWQVKQGTHTFYVFTQPNQNKNNWMCSPVTNPIHKNYEFCQTRKFPPGLLSLLPNIAITIIITIILTIPKSATKHSREPFSTQVADTSNAELKTKS